MRHTERDKRQKSDFEPTNTNNNNNDDEDDEEISNSNQS